MTQLLKVLILVCVEVSMWADMSQNLYAQLSDVLILVCVEVSMWVTFNEQGKAEVLEMS